MGYDAHRGVVPLVVYSSIYLVLSFRLGILHFCEGQVSSQAIDAPCRNIRSASSRLHTLPPQNLGVVI